MEWIIFWLIGSVVVGVVAGSRGRSGFGYFLLALFLSPLLALILALALPRLNDAAGDLIMNKTHVRCPDCREVVRMDARKCKHCGSTLAPQVPELKWPPG